MDRNHLIPGLHATRDALLSTRIKIRELWITEDKRSARIDDILSIAQSKGIPVRFKKIDEMEKRLPGVNHQGVAALAEQFSYSDLEDILSSTSGDAPALLIAADHITDEGNLGALIRTGAFFGAHGLILPKRRSAEVTPRVIKSSCGGHLYLPVVRVVNMVRALEILDKKGFWIIGAAGEGNESIYDFDWNRHLVLVLGSEDRGLSRLVRSRCHQIVRIPSCGHVGALNVSVAAGIMLSEITRQRSLKIKSEVTL
jgi:23S rRNA (guanosine2251-2'-O)-methyltransferase